ncbi:hypothetical protein BIY24_05375 [Halobacteriovorax marinus]|uniref:DUF374 domain-containing protein n=1 Tax=Halobacteriovorax marinus (strain ATCC BAA-682 / DSM 15412 / SJ) TaxID=862908 RepID=E1WYG2_HALMS|nr:lysophospholipid acyltransferase family protein [Halobacteriovorax marinus]ATH07388.1 hypothetical protein BIY24_05375 [Halobacteriovorax marinus]CBW26010.1 conserved hypothetical protein [Halobacteriovorax marinus SJ]
MFLSYIIYFIAKAFSASYRYKYLGLENIANAQSQSKHKNYLLGIWHQNLLHGILAQVGNPHIVIVSKSKDADPVAFTCRKIGTIVVRGSSRNAQGVDKNGKEAKLEMIEKLKEGYPGAVTVDGPKGPAKKVKPGIVDMALKSETVIIPYLPIPESYWSFNSWDKFRLPKPFSRIVVLYGKPIVASSSENFESYQVELESSLNDLEEKAKEALVNWKNLSSKNWHQNK